MKKLYIAVPVISAILLITGLINQKPFRISGDEGVRTGLLEAKPDHENKKILVVYFSHTGNTREVAASIQKITGGDIFEIVPLKKYPDDYEELKRVAKKELKSGDKPPLKSKAANLKSYDIVFIGYPIWWGTFPAPVRTFLSENDLSGKTVIPFCTHLGSGLGNSVKDVAGLCLKSKLLEGIDIWGNKTSASRERLTGWLKKINIIKQ